MSDYCAFLANCLAKGDEISKKADGGWIRDTIQWELDGYRIILKQREEVILGGVSDFKKKWVDTSRLIIKNVPENKVKKAQGIVENVAALLSFAGLSQIRVFGHEYPMGSGKRSFISTIGNCAYFRPTIDILNGSTLKTFIATCWDGFKRNKKIRKLPLVFEYLATAEATICPLELKLVTLFIVLESLKDTYAKEQGIPYVKGFYRKISTPPKANPANEPKYKFEELLLLMLNEKGIKKGLKCIISLRNDLIHSGLTRKPFRSLWKTYCNAQDTIRLYLLKILGYSGTYRSYSERNGVKRI
jgi:hypothetical protein